MASYLSHNAHGLHVNMNHIMSFSTSKAPKKSTRIHFSFLGPWLHILFWGLASKWTMYYSPSKGWSCRHQVGVMPRQVADPLSLLPNPLNPEINKLNPKMQVPKYQEKKKSETWVEENPNPIRIWEILQKTILALIWVQEHRINPSKWRTKIKHIIIHLIWFSC